MTVATYDDDDDDGEADITQSDQAELAINLYDNDWATSSRLLKMPLPSLILVPTHPPNAALMAV